MSIDTTAIYCVARFQNKISVLNKQNGQLIREMKHEHLLEPCIMTLFNRDYFFSNSLHSNSVSKFSLLDGKIIKSFKEIEGATGMVLNDKTNHLLVCSHRKKKIVILDCKSLEMIREVE